MASSRFDRYRLLFAKLSDSAARTLIDRLQVMALVEPDTLREMEKFLDRGGAFHPGLGAPPIARPDSDCR